MFIFIFLGKWIIILWQLVSFGFLVVVDHWSLHTNIHTQVVPLDIGGTVVGKIRSTNLCRHHVRLYSQHRKASTANGLGLWRPLTCTHLCTRDIRLFQISPRLAEAWSAYDGLSLSFLLGKKVLKHAKQTVEKDFRHHWVQRPFFQWY